MTEKHQAKGSLKFLIEPDGAVKSGEIKIDILDREVTISGDIYYGYSALRKNIKVWENFIIDTEWMKSFFWYEKKPHANIDLYDYKFRRAMIIETDVGRRTVHITDYKTLSTHIIWMDLTNDYIDIYKVESLVPIRGILTKLTLKAQQ